MTSQRRPINNIGDKVNFTIRVSYVFLRKYNKKHKIVKLQGQLYDLLLYVFLMKFNKKT